MPWILLEALLQQPLNDRRRFADIGLILDHRREHVRHILALEQSLASDHLVEHATESPDIRTFVERLAPGLFWRHIGRRPEDRAVHVIAGDVSVGEIVRCATGSTMPSIALASPKASTFT